MPVDVKGSRNMSQWHKQSMYPALIEYTTQLTWGNYEYIEKMELVSVGNLFSILNKSITGWYNSNWLS